MSYKCFVFAGTLVSASISWSRFNGFGIAGAKVSSGQSMRTLSTVLATDEIMSAAVHSFTSHWILAAC